MAYNFTARQRYLLILLGLLVPFSVLFALINGSVDISINQLFNTLTGDENDLSRRIVLELRWPRVITAFAVGGLLALAGILMQVLLRNPLADPYVLGISGGAATAVLLAMLAGLGGVMLNLSAFGGALFSMILVFGTAQGRGSWTSARLLLSGVVIAFAWGALISFILAIAADQQLRSMLFWLMGDLSYSDNPLISVAVLVVCIFLCMIMARSLNVLGRGEHQAAALGVSVSAIQFRIYLLASFMTATAVTQAGSIGFIGLVVPHILRLAIGSDHRILIPASVLLGGSLLLLADTLARTLLAPQQLPVGIFTAMLGVPLFLFLLHRGQARNRL